jgi:hypothetical protein
MTSQKRPTKRYTFFSSSIISRNTKLKYIFAVFFSTLPNKSIRIHHLTLLGNKIQIKNFQNKIKIKQQQQQQHITQNENVVSIAAFCLNILKEKVSK